MSKILEWFRTRRRRQMVEYEETKKEFEKVMRRPAITITLELSEDLKGLEAEFLLLEKDEEFIKAVEELAKRYLKKKERMPR